MVVVHKLWFRAKWYGWGWTPVWWQGWVTLVICLGVGLWPLVTTDSYYSGVRMCSDPNAQSDCVTAGARSHDIVLASVWFLVWLGILIWICYRKGEKPHWRWGK